MKPNKVTIITILFIIISIVYIIGNSVYKNSETIKTEVTTSDSTSYFKSKYDSTSKMYLSLNEKYAEQVKINESLSKQLNQTIFKQSFGKEYYENGNVKYEWGETNKQETQYIELYNKSIDSIKSLQIQIESLKVVSKKIDTIKVTQVSETSSKTEITKNNSKDGVFIYATTGVEYELQHAFNFPVLAGIKYKFNNPIFISTEVEKQNITPINGLNYNFKANIGVEF